MIRIPSVAVPLDAPPERYADFAARALSIPRDRVLACRVSRRSVDARRKDDVHLALTLDVTVAGDEAATLRRAAHPQAKLVEEMPAPQAIRLSRAPRRRPIVIGAGPAGLFAALTLARAGARPLVLERGRDALSRRADIERFWAGGPLNPQSNVQFGEGGAGTFSDGKLGSGIKDPRGLQVLRDFVACGAPESILHEAKPHVGTDHLIAVVQGMRRAIEALGGTVRFEAQVHALHAEDGTLRGLLCGDGEMVDADAAALCIGHSARDTLQALREAGIALAQKPFSIGARIEHPQALIDRAQYGRFAGHPALGAADYRLSARLKSGRGVYTFCMCPGGQVIAAASEPGGVVTNGMSNYARDAENANSALLVDVRPEDFDSDDPLAGIAFQRRWERLAFSAGGGSYRAPAQRVADFLAGQAPASLQGARPTYLPGAVPGDLRACLPAFATEAMAEGLRLFDRRLAGFAGGDAVLTGVETRSSSPVRILRDGEGHASLRGLFPAGEGAGYAGGILSAAVDGIRTAEHMLRYLSLTEVSDASL